MKWLEQKSKVRSLEDELQEKVVENKYWRSIAVNEAKKGLRKDGVAIWAFSGGMLWEISRDTSIKSVHSTKRRLSKMTKATMFLVRLFGFRL